MSMEQKHTAEPITETRLSEMEAHADAGGTFQPAIVQELIGHIRTTDRYRANARTIDQFPPEGERTKENEWEACYATLFRQMQPIMDENARLKAAKAQPDKADVVEACKICHKTDRPCLCDVLCGPLPRDALPAEVVKRFTIQEVREIVAAQVKAERHFTHLRGQIACKSAQKAGGKLAKQLLEMMEAANVKS